VCFELVFSRRRVETLLRDFSFFAAVVAKIRSLFFGTVKLIRIACACNRIRLIMKKSARRATALIGVIFGEKGTGKTKQILELANKSVLTAKGNTIFIDNDTSYIYDLSRKARFINATEYGITTPKMLYGFLCGLAASDFDLETIYIDGLLNIIGHELDSLEGLFDDLKRFSEKNRLSVIMSITGSKETVPTYMKEYLL
jgi:hypothetical protein